MDSLKNISTQAIKKIKMIFFDIDDTFSGSVRGSENEVIHDARISSEAYNSLWNLRAKGIKLVPVTGRPAGWCDMIARMWPVDAIVGENGAFYMFMNEKKRKLEKVYLESTKTRLVNSKKLLSLEQKIYKKFKEAKVASDQFCREFDLAIDFCEDVKPWPTKRVDELIDFCTVQGAQVKLSSIHVNIWYGQYDKLLCVKKFMKEMFSLTDLESVLYIGDSPNDEPFFKNFPVTVGVANVAKFLDRMTFYPKFVTSQSCGLGFQELEKKF